MQYREPTSEDDFESMLIRHLQNLGGNKQWQYEPSLNTEAALWQNFKSILEQNNQDKLGDRPILTDSEFAQVKSEILRQCRTPYDAGHWIYGINGITQVELIRDKDPHLGSMSSGEHIYLNVFDQDQVGAGNTRYQIVNQVWLDSMEKGDHNRRLDTTLLINGLPLIHIEEKYKGHDSREALNQIHQYIDENIFRGIYSTVQIFIAMTPNDTRYMANSESDNFNKDFSFRWQRESDSKPVFLWDEFCNLMLSIPMAHEMSTRYMILDGRRDAHKLIVMRPYQVYATRRVITRLRQHNFGMDPQEIGYIWHTTGSGKTISSFKTAWLASRLPNVDKVVFVVDRRALTKQTFENYQAYDPDSTDVKSGVVADTASTSDLSRKLRSTNTQHNIVVTSIQKLGELVKRKRFKGFDKNTVFIVDEAHRSTNGETLSAVKAKFPNSAWIGYTGTPVFRDDLTHKAFRNVIHAYTIREAIQDQNVLGFKVDFEKTLSDDVVKEQLLPRLIERRYPETKNDKQLMKQKIASMEEKEVEELIDSKIYDNNKSHVQAVVKNIIQNWPNRSADGLYSAILTTHVNSGVSSPMAMMYFREFQKANKELRSRGKRPLNVAVTFSWSTDNHDDMLANNSGLHEAMRIYNQTFGTLYGTKSVDEYFIDVMDRLRGTREDGEKLDLVIVIDQLLTGYDAPKVNTLYVDRILSGSSLIQAFSRTNRIDDNEKKPWGRIVCFRYPQTAQKLMDDALSIYANRHSADYQGKLGEGGAESDNEDDSSLDGVLSQSFSALLEDAKEQLHEIKSLSDDFTIALPPRNDDKQRAISLISSYNADIAKLKQCTEFDYENPDRLLEELGVTSQQHEHVVTVMRNELSRWAKNNDQDGYFGISALDFEVEHVKEIKVDYDYIDDLLAEVLNKAHEHDETVDQSYRNLVAETAKMQDQTQAERINATARAAMDGNEDLLGLSDSDYPVNRDKAQEVVGTFHNKSAKVISFQFRKKWGLLDVESASHLIELILKKHMNGRDDIAEMPETNELLTSALQPPLYKDEADDTVIRNLSLVRYKNGLREALKAFAEQISNL